MKDVVQQKDLGRNDLLKVIKYKISARQEIFENEGLECDLLEKTDRKSVV